MAKANDRALSVGFLYDDTLDHSDGVATYVKTLGAWLSANGHQTAYLVGETRLREWAGGQVYSLARNQQVMFNQNRMSIPLPANKPKIRRLMKELELDVLHVQVPYSPFLAARVIRAADDKVAVVGTFHIFPSGWLVAAATRWLSWLLSDTLQRFDKIMAVSRPAAKFAKKSFGTSSQVVPNMVELDTLRPLNRSKNSQQQSNKIVFLGRLIKRKGCIQLLRAFNRLQQSLPDARLTVAGDGPERQRLTTYVKRHSLENKVRFLGSVSEKEKPSILQTADIACFPSIGGESFGIVLIEAMAAGGGVVIGGNNPGYSSVLANNQRTLFDPRNEEELYHILHKLLTDKQLASQLHNWQQQHVEKFDVNIVGPLIVDIYRRAIAMKAKKRHNSD